MRTAGPAIQAVQRDPSSERQSIAHQSLQGYRVLVLFGAVPLHGQERGTIEVFRTLACLGLKARFITNERWGHEHVQPELTRHSLEWVTAPFGPRLGKNLFGLDLLRGFRDIVRTNLIFLREIRQWNPTHLCVMNWVYFVHACPALLATRRPLIYRLGDCPPDRSFLHRAAWRLISSRTSCFVCVSRFVERRLLANPAGLKKHTVIYSSPPVRPAGEALEIPEPPQGAAVLTFVGQITREKGILILIDAARRLLSTGRNIVVWVAGDYSWRNPMAHEVVAQLRREGLAEHIRFLGYVRNVPALFKKSTLHICPSVWGDPLPNVVLEAKRQGVPSVVFPDGGLPELIEHQTDGFVCADTTVEALIQGIEWFLDRPRDLDRAGQAARESLERRFSRERFEAQWANVFRESASAQPTVNLQRRRLVSSSKHPIR